MRWIKDSVRAEVVIYNDGVLRVCVPASTCPRENIDARFRLENHQFLIVQHYFIQKKSSILKTGDLICSNLQYV
jgi:hypothetical protein